MHVLSVSGFHLTLMWSSRMPSGCDSIPKNSRLLKPRQTLEAGVFDGVDPRPTGTGNVVAYCATGRRRSIMKCVGTARMHLACGVAAIVLNRMCEDFPGPMTFLNEKSVWTQLARNQLGLSANSAPTD